jgi:hypothetical protein
MRGILSPETQPAGGQSSIKMSFLFMFHFVGFGSFRLAPSSAQTQNPSRQSRRGGGWFDRAFRRKCYDQIERHLSKGRLIVVLAFALVLASTQCAALCIVGPCTDAATTPAGEPPCHHQHEVPDNQTPAPCPHQTVQADVPQAFASALTSLDSIAAVDIPVVLTVEYSSISDAHFLPWLDLSPPGPQSLPGSAILRI